MDTAAGLNAGCGAQVQHHVVVWLAPGEAVAVVIFQVMVESVVGILAAHQGTGIVVQASGPKAAASDAHPGIRVHAHVMPRVDLSQKLGAQVLGQWRVLGVQDNVVQLFGQQFAVQVDVGAVPVGRQSELYIRRLHVYRECK